MHINSSQNDFIIEYGSIELWRHADPTLGPRKTPTVDDITANRLLLSENTIFHINIDNNSIVASENGTKTDIGNQLCYITR